MSAATVATSFSFRRIFIALGLAVMVPLLSACGFNTIPTNEEKAKAAWGEVQTSTSAAPISCPIWSRP